MEDIEQRMLEFVAKQTGVNAKKLTLESRLLHDLGMDGDDASEFYETYSKEFGVSIEQLGRNWRDYFGTEGFPPDIGAFVLTVTVFAPPALLSWLSVHRMNIAVTWKWLLGFPLFVILFLCELQAWAAIQHRFFNHDDEQYVPMKIRDLVEGVRTGKLQAPGKLLHMLPNNLQSNSDQHQTP